MQNTWRVLTEVPGWPDAPVWAKCRRALPVLLPLIAMLALLVWSLAVHAPRVRRESQALAPLVALESEIVSLRIASDREIAALAEKTTEASRTLIDGDAEAAAFLRTLKKEAADRGWEASFHLSDGVEDATASAGGIEYLSVRARLKPAATNNEPFTTLQTLLERFSSLGKRIDLMTLAIRADEKRWQTVELTLRLTRPVSHAQTP